MKDRTLLVTVDSLRYDHLQYMPTTQAYLQRTHDAAFATCTATLGSFPSLVGGEYPEDIYLDPDQGIANAFGCPSVGITTNHLLSERYGYDGGFDSFSSPRTEESLKQQVAPHLTIGSPVYRIASFLWQNYQQVLERVSSVEKSFRPADSVISEFFGATEDHDSWFAWLHFMEPHYPYDPDTADIGRAKAQALTRKVIAGNGTESEQRHVRRLYRREVEELDDQLAHLWTGIPDDTRLIFSADHGELLGEDGLWGHPGVTRPELLHVPFGTRNAPCVGDLVSLIDVPSLLIGEEHGHGTFDREVAFAAYGDQKAAINTNHIASRDGTITHRGDPAEDSALERKLKRFTPSGVVKEDAVMEDLKELGYA